MELDTSNREKVVILHSNSTVIYWEQFIVICYAPVVINNGRACNEWLFILSEVK